MGVKADSVIGADFSTHLAAGALRLVYKNNPFRSLLNGISGADLNTWWFGAMVTIDTLKTKLQVPIYNHGAFGHYADTINPCGKLMLHLASHFARMASYTEVTIMVQESSLSAHGSSPYFPDNCVPQLVEISPAISYPLVVITVNHFYLRL